MSSDPTVQVKVVGGPSVAVSWFSGMNAQQALEDAYNQVNDTQTFTYALQYYGTGLGYLVVMINETYDSFISSSAPFFYWEFFINGQPATTGINNVVLNAGDAIAFSLQMYLPEQHASSTAGTKHAFQVRAAASRNR